MTADHDKYPEALADMRADLEALLVVQGVDAQQAKGVAYNAVETLRQRWGGMYLPKGTGINLSRRDREIARQWNGSNKAEICRRYDISDVRFYQILAKQRAEQVAARQQRLF